ncbi:chromosome segregation protein SMC [Marinospirillum alkaliphilum]|uniref:Chromosome partition protein Smc n=1 Tax=Marinospirillum alkaliphilum DSM 21637 TaxID=1122209 RepID=A0A1K1VDX8_9GAMM|nr:chromosome segregation protein SMC [Marinospirillum alkaliphilum]SFX22923.1 condensin subunit Smc [Marinospirillum alkaliphilum DSM 21637]
MRLKSIKLAGFKSFVDPTTVSFKSNMTAIVGPNGCGKSNVIDAVRWVMGESSAKYLRGESMTDVIFNGSRNRKPVGQASIELVFDNREGKLGGAYAQYAEISVKRVVTRDAQSSYLLNGSKCRRRDITDLFLGTGLGARSYAIIEQGMISRLIEARPEELRVYLEEAAGISKYKERRRETENRMRRTQENLERLSDVREELGRQLERLGRQAEAARRFQQLKAGERRLKSELAVLRWREADHRLAGILEQIAELELKQEACLVTLRQGEARLEASREHQAQATDALEVAQKQLTETSLQIARLEQGMQHRLQRERQLQAELEQQKQQRQQAEQAMQQDREQLALLQQELEELLPLVEELIELEATEQLRMDELEQQLQVMQDHWDDFVADAEKDQREAALAQARIQQHERSLSSLRERMTRLQEQQQQLAVVDEEDEQLQHLLMEREGLEDRLLELDTADEQQQEQRLTLQERQRDLRQQLQQASSRLQQVQGRLASLQALQQAELDGQDAELESWLKAQQLDRWLHLGEVLQVSDGWEKAVEVALRDALAALLSEVPLDQQLPQQLADLPAGDLLLYQQQGQAASRDGLLQYLSNPECLPASLALRLARCRPVSNLEQAWQQRQALTDDQCCITPRGEQVFRDGLLLQAETARSTGVLARQQEIRRLEQEQLALDAQLESLEQEEEQQHARLQACEASIQQQAALRRPLQQQLSELASQQASLQTRIQHSRQRSQQLADELQQLQQEQQLLLETLAEDQERWQEALLQLETNSEQRESRQQQRDALREQREQQRQQLRQRQQVLQEARLKQQQLVTREQAADQALQRLEEQLQRLDERHEHLLLELEAAREPIDEPGEQLNDLLQLHREQETSVQQLRQQQQQAQQEQRELEQQRSLQDRELDRLRGLLEQQRLQQQGLMVKRDSHLEQLRELDLTLRAVMEQLPEDALESRWQADLEDTQERIRRLGAINLAAIEEYDQQAERKAYLDAQNAELEDALNTLDQAIKRIDRETKVRFRETFEQVNQGLQALFPKVFGGGTAWLQLTGDDLLETGVAIMARPPGKKNATIHLLSGGEKALTALALVFSIFELNPAPFCMLDEVDAPLDDANVGRYAKLVREMSERIQFIYITHNKQAMESAEQLMGVTMQEPGVSRLVSVDLEEASAMVAS